MKKIVFCFILLGISAVFAVEPQFAPVSPRAITIGSKSAIDLIKNDEVLFSVYVPPRSSKTVSAAAREFTGLLSRITGKKISLLRTLGKDNNKIIFRIGDTAFAKNLAVDLKKLDRDGFVIKTSKNNILISGNDILNENSGTGTLFGVYDFLERFADCRFYFPGQFGELIPRKKNWSIPEIDISDRPDSQYRRIFRGSSPRWYDKTTNVAAAWEKHKKHLRISTAPLPNAHGLNYLRLLERFLKTNPEYFAIDSHGRRRDGSFLEAPSDKFGHICFSSNIKEEIYQDAKALLSGKSAKSRGVKQANGVYRWAFHKKPYFNLAFNDSMVRCRCKNCAPYFVGLTDHGGYSQKAADFIWQWTLDFARRLKAEKIPGYVTISAYDLRRNIPDEDIPDNILVGVAAIGPWQERMPERQKKDIEHLRRWSEKLGHKINTWNYVTKFNVKWLPDIPNITPRAIASYYAKIYPYSFGTFLEGSSDYWFFEHLNCYVFSKIMWDHKVDINALLSDYCRQMFGKSAEPMLKVIDILENHWMENIVGNTVMTSVGPVSTPPSEHDLWFKIFTEKEVARIEKLFDSAERLSKKDKEALARIRLLRRELWGPTFRARKNYFDKTAAVDCWQTDMGLLKPGEKININGKADDPAWKTAPTIALLPKKTDKIEVKTFVKLLADDKNFYFLFDCREPQTDKMYVLKQQFDSPDIWAGNAVEIHLDTAGKRIEDYQFMIDCLGQTADLRRVPGKLQTDFKWNSSCKTAAAIVPGKGYFVEVSIPRRSLPPVNGKKFVANFTRHRVINGQKVLAAYSWSPYAKNFGDLPNFGTVHLGTSPDKNLFTDGDFKVTGLKNTKGSSWFNWGHLPYRDENIFRTAGVSMRLENKRRDLVHRVTSLKPDTLYRLSFFVRRDKMKLHPGKKPAGSGFFVRIDEGNGKAYTYPRNQFFGSQPWMRLEHTFRTSKNTPGTKYRPYIHFALRNVDGTVWIDHAELIELPSK